MGSLFQILLEKGKIAEHKRSGITNITQEEKKGEKDEITQTISQWYMPLKKLKLEYPYNEKYIKNIHQLMVKFAAWKRSRGDGNCYYRSVITSFMIKLFHPCTPKTYRDIFWAKLKEIESIDFFSDIEVSYKYFVNNFTELYYRNDHFLEIHRLLQILEFDQSLISISRALTYIEAKKKIEGGEFKEILLDNEAYHLLENIKTMGREAESLELFLLPSALNIEVTQINVFDNWIETHYPEHYSDSMKIKVSVISKSKGHYDGLYSKEELENDSFNLKKRDYIF